MKKRPHLIALLLLLFTQVWSQPTITSFSPESGAAGTSITITGTNFSATAANNIVYFGAVKATVTAATTTNLEVTVPYGATIQPISVTVAGQVALALRPFLSTFSGSTGSLNSTDFSSKSDLMAGTNPFASAVSDIDGDGKVDVVIGNFGEGTLSIFRNTSAQGSISYAPKQDMVIFMPTSAIVFADLDGDGKQDMITVNKDANLISAFRNTSSPGTISFASTQSFATGSGPQHAAVGDLDGDGKLDIAVVNTNANTVSVFRNTSSLGSISFAAKFDISTSTTPYYASIGDLTSDNKPDIAVACVDANAVSVFRNTSTVGTISYAGKSDFTVGTNPRCVLIQDLNADGKQDLIVANNGGNNVSILRNSTFSGVVSFSSILYSFPTNGSPFFLSLADISGDGKVDILATTTTDNELTILKNTTTSSTFTFDAAVDFSTGSSPIGISVADLDNDGKPDIVTANYVDNTFSTLRNQVKTGQTITFSPIAAVTYGDDEFSLSASATSGLPVTFYSSNTAVATVSGNVVTIVGGGTSNIYALQAGNDDYAAAPDVIRTLTVNKASQTINFSALPTKNVGDAPFLLTATASSGLPVTYGNSHSVVATLSGNEVTIQGIGTTTITAYQFGDANYLAATNVQQNLTVEKGQQTISFGPISDKSFGDQDFVLNGTSSSGLAVSYVSSNPSVATVMGDRVSVVGVGTTTITASQSGDDNFLPAMSVDQELIVTKGSQTIVFDALPTKALGDADFQLLANVSSGLPITFTSSNEDVATINGDEVTIIGVGTTTITATQAGSTNYFAATSVTQQLTVYPAGQQITFNALSSKVFGDPSFLLNATSSSGLTVSYTSSDPSVATIVGNEVSITGVGNTLITASQSGNTNFAPAQDVSQILTVAKANQVISFNALSEKSIGDEDFNLSATSSSGLNITYTIDNPSVATINGNNVTIVGVGTANITASQSGNNQYNSAEDVTQVLTVTKATQQITFNSLTGKVFGDPVFQLNAISSSGLTVTYSSDNLKVATIIENQVTIVGAGIANITAYQSGNENFESASPVSQQLNVTKANQSISFASLPDKTFGNKNFNISATASSGLPISFSSDNSSVVMMMGDSAIIVGAGQVSITASQSGNENYMSAVDVTHTFEVNKAAQDISFPMISEKIFGAEDFALSAMINSGLTITYVSDNSAVALISGNMVQIVGAGETTITASQSGGSNYLAATPVSQTLIVNKAEQVITFEPLEDRVFGDGVVILTAVGGLSGVPVEYISSDTNVATISDNMLSIHGAGSVVITANQAGNANYHAASSVSQTLDIEKAAQQITFSTITAKSEGDAPFTLTATATSGLEVGFTSSNSAVATVEGDQVTIKGAGTTIITASQAGNSNYQSAISVEQTLVVKANQTITFAALPDKTFGNKNFKISAIASSGLPISFSSDNSSVVMMMGDSAIIVGAGQVSITASQSGNENYMAAVDVTHTFEVNKAAQDISFPMISEMIFGAEDFALSAMVNSGLTITYVSDNSAVALISGNMVQIVGAGETTITASQSGGSNYLAATPVSQTLIVNKAEQVITFEPLEDRVFGDGVVILTAVGGLSGVPVEYTSSDTNVATISDNMLSIHGAGSVVITASQAGNANYHAASSVSQTLDIEKAAQQITFSTITAKSEGDAPFTLTATATSGLEVGFTSSNSAVATVEGDQVTIKGAGTTIITASQAGNSNYQSAISVEQTLVVKANQSISFAALADMTYGDSELELSATTTSDLAITYASSNSDVATINGSILKITGAGTAVISAKQEGNENFNPAIEINQDLQVGKAPLSATAENETMDEGDNVPTFSITYSGFVNGDDASDLDILPVIGTEATSSSPAGTYEIELSGGSDNNYELHLINGVLTILEVDLTLGDDHESELLIYPNPASDYIQVKTRMQQEISIYDLAGQYLLSGETNQLIDIQSLPSGVFLIKTGNRSLLVVKK